MVGNNGAYFGEERFTLINSVLSNLFFIYIYIFKIHAMAKKIQKLVRYFLLGWCVWGKGSVDYQIHWNIVSKPKKWY